MRQVGPVLAAALCALALTACSSSHAKGTGSTSSGPTVLKSPIQIRSLKALGTPCHGQQPRLSANPDPAVAVEAPDATGKTCFPLTPAIAVITQVTDIAALAPSVPGSLWTITFGPTSPQSGQLSSYTSSHHVPAGQDPSTVVQDPSEYLVTLVAGYVVEASVIEAPIGGTQLQASVQGGKAEASQLISTLTGK